MIDTFEIGVNVKSSYYGIAGVVVKHGEPFGGRPSIVVEHQVQMLDDFRKVMTVRRTFLAQDFQAAS